MPTLALEALRGLTGRLLTLGLVHALWIGLLSASTAAVALRLLPPRARQARHRLLLALLTITALGPIAATTTQRSLKTSTPPRPPASLSRSLVVLSGRVLDALATPTTPPTSHPVPALSLAHRSSVIDPRFFSALQPFLLAAWLTVFVTLAAILSLGVVSSGRLRRSSRPAPPTIQARSDRLARRLGLRRCPPVLVQRHLVEPGLVGLFTPAIRVLRERLILIRPRRIILEPEEERLGSPAITLPQTQPAPR